VVDRATTKDKKGINSWLVVANGATAKNKKKDKILFFYILMRDEWWSVLVGIAQQKILLVLLYASDFHVLPYASDFLISFTPLNHFLIQHGNNSLRLWLIAADEPQS
jgi:hypothetical protein